jgi:hypothetical protein
MRTLRTIAAAAIATVGVLGLAAPAQAMGTGNPYQDMQVGVTYTVYEPSYTAGLTLQHFGGNAVCPKGTEQNSLGVYGKASARQFSIWEGNPMCQGIGIGATVLTATVDGAKATIQAYCDPASKKACTKADVLKYGGNLQVTLPAAKGLRPTTVWIETFGTKNLSAQQLLKIARSMAAVQ